MAKENPPSGATLAGWRVSPRKSAFSSSVAPQMNTGTEAQICDEFKKNLSKNANRV
jgi:hypothetical protein